MLYYLLKYHWVLWLILLFMFFPPTKEDLLSILFIAIGMGIIFSVAYYLDKKRKKRIAASKKDEGKIITPDSTEVEDKPEEHNVVDSDLPYSIADEIEKYANLRDRGVITEEEFAQQKKKLLELDPLGRK